MGKSFFVNAITISSNSRTHNFGLHPTFVNMHDADHLDAQTIFAIEEASQHAFVEMYPHLKGTKLITVFINVIELDRLYTDDEINQLRLHA